MFLDTLRKYLVKNGVERVREVTYLDDYRYVQRNSGCETCGPEYDIDETIYIYYTDFDGKQQKYSEEISFSRFLQELIEL